MGVFSKVGNWLTDKSNQFIRGDAEIPGSYYASDEAEAAYSGLHGGTEGAQTTARRQPIAPFGGDENDEYGGRVPYRSKNTSQNTGSFTKVMPGQVTGPMQTVTPGQNTGSYPAVNPMQPTGAFAPVQPGQTGGFPPNNPTQAAGGFPPINPTQATGAFPPVSPAQATGAFPPVQPMQATGAYAPVSPVQATGTYAPVNPQSPYAGYTPNAPPAPQQTTFRSNYPPPAPQGSNCVPFPGSQPGADGAAYAHIEYVVLLRSFNECRNVIDCIKQNASVFLNMEFIESVFERQRCVDMLSGAAYTMGCKLNKISPRGIYLISSPSVRVVIDQAMRRFTSEPEARGYTHVAYPQEQPYAAAPQAGVPLGNPPQSGYGFAPVPPAPQEMQPAQAEAAQPMFRKRPANSFSSKPAGAYGQSRPDENAKSSFQTPASAGFGKRTGTYQQ